jgi:hypothetical protein
MRVSSAITYLRAWKGNDAAVGDQSVVETVLFASQAPTCRFRTGETPRLELGSGG